MTVVTATISNLKGGVATPMDPQYELLAIDITKEIDRVPIAELVLLDGDAAQQQFAISDADFFKPGEKIQIQLRYEGESDTTVFVGFIVKHRIQYARQRSQLTLYLKDAAFRLTQLRKNAIFRDMDDVAIVRDILDAAIAASDGDLKLGALDPAPAAIAHPEMVQYYCSDWDFIRARAEANGLWVLANDGEISVRDPSAIAGAAVLFTFGRSEIYDFEMETDLRGQFARVEAIAWDSKAQDLLAPQAGDDYALAQGDSDPAAWGTLLGGDRSQLVGGGELAAPEIQAWASAKIAKSRRSLVRGRLHLPGQGDLLPGAPIELEKFGKRFDGETLITGIRHQVSAEGWQTDIQFGASARSFAASDEIAAPPANGLLPAVSGLQIGVVAATDADPTGQLRVQVKIPRLTPTIAAQPSAKNDGLVWARLATLEAGLGAEDSPSPGRGSVFRPEPNDEVVVGFLNDDPRQAVILGALYGDAHKPPLAVTAENEEKGIVTKQGLQLVFNDKDKSISLVTPNANLLLLSDGAETIQLVDASTNQVVLNTDGVRVVDASGNQLVLDTDGVRVVDANGNQLVTDASGITLESGADLTIAASGNIILKGAAIDVR